MPNQKGKEVITKVPLRSWIFVRLMDEEYVINEKKGWIVFYEKKKKEGSTGNEKCFTSGPALLR
jgi:hypothetical protein